MAALKTAHTTRRTVRISRRPNLDRTHEIVLPAGYDIGRDLEADLLNPDERSAHPSEAADALDDMARYFGAEESDEARVAAIGEQLAFNAFVATVGA